MILLSAHVGNWEWGAAFLAATGARVHLVARPHKSRGLDEFFARRRARWGLSPLAVRPLWVRAARALRRREWVAVMEDRTTPGVRGSAGEWAAALARRTGALLLPAVMVRLARGRYAACFEPPLPPGRHACERGRDAVRRHLARHPGQWCAFEPVPEGVA